MKLVDYQGIQFVKRLRRLDDKVKQRAEVAVYFQKFDEAEALYRDIDRKDLAIELRMRLGDWLRVVQLLQVRGWCVETECVVSAFGSDVDCTTGGWYGDWEIVWCHGGSKRIVKGL